MKTGIKTTFHNKFTVERRDKDTNELLEVAYGYNTVLDSFLDRLLSALSGQSYSDYTRYILAYIAYGSGTGTLDRTRTSLFTPLDVKAASTYEEEIINDLTYSITRKIVIEAGENVGDTLREVGFAYFTDSTDIVTHAILEDSEGSPISITKTATDVITIYATLYVTLTASTNCLFTASNIFRYYLVNGSYCISGYDYDFTAKRKRTSTIMTKSIDTGVSNFTTIDNVNKKITIPIRFEAGEANNEVITHVGFVYKEATFVGYADFSNEESVITGDVLGTGDGIETEFTARYDNIKSGSATVYIDGVEVTSGVTIEEDTFVNREDKLYWDVASVGNRFLRYSRCDNIDEIFDTPLVDLPYEGDVNSSPDDREIIIEPESPIVVSSMGLYRDDLDCEIHYKCVGDTEWTSIFDNRIISAVTHTLSFTGVTEPIAQIKLLLCSTDGSGSFKINSIDCGGIYPAYTVKFDTPPAVDEVVTMDYTVQGIAKDANHVLDVELEISLGDGGA